MENRRERIRPGRRPSPRERIYDVVSLLLLMWPATGGMGLMGSTRVWGYAPGLALSLAGSALVLSRPLWFFRTPRWAAPPGFGLWALMTVYVALGVGWAAVPHAAREAALRWGCLLAAGFAWTQLGLREHRWKWVLGVLLAAVALNGLYAWVQHMDGSRMVLWMPRAEQYGLRASGTYLCPNHLANLIALLVPVALVLIALPAAGFPLRMLSGYYLVVTLPVLYWTQSRSGWLGMAGGVGTALLLLAWRKSRTWLLTAVVALPLLGAAGGFAAWHALPAVRERIGQVLENPVKAGGIRMEMWRDAPAMFRAQPWLGHGGGGYAWAYPPFQRNVTQHLHYDYVHNDYIQLALEHGAVGLGLAGLALLVSAWGIGRAVRRSRSDEPAVLLAGAAGALAACLLHALFDFNFHIFPNPHALVWVVGLSWGVWAAMERGVEPPAGREQVLRRAAGAAGAAGCVLGVWWSLSMGMAYYWNLKADLARSRLEWDRVERDYRRAIRWDRLDWQPHLGLGHFKAGRAMWYRDPDLAAEQEGKRQLAEEAIGHYEAALARNPREMAAEFGQARALNAAGRPEEALAHLRRAADYQPRHVFYREQLGIQLRRMGRDREALQVFRRNVEDQVATEVSTLNIRALERSLARENAAAEPAAAD